MSSKGKKGGPATKREPGKRRSTKREPGKRRSTKRGSQALSKDRREFIKSTKKYKETVFNAIDDLRQEWADIIEEYEEEERYNDRMRDEDTEKWLDGERGVNAYKNQHPLLNDWSPKWTDKKAKEVHERIERQLVKEFGFKVEKPLRSHKRLKEELGVINDLYKKYHDKFATRLVKREEEIRAEIKKLIDEHNAAEDKIEEARKLPESTFNKSLAKLTGYKRSSFKRFEFKK